MPTRSETHYFGAGPARLPTSVLERASASLLNHNNTGLGLAEHSHRSGLSSGILATASESFANLLNVPEGYTLLFMQGGGTTQFSSVVYNLLGYWVEKRMRRYGGDVEKVRRDWEAQGPGVKAEYILTGGWSLKASQEAGRLLGEERVSIVADSRRIEGAGGKWGGITPEGEWKLEDAAKGKSLLTYFCDNETVDGVEFPEFPQALKDGLELENRDVNAEERLVVGDMSSNILSREVDVKRFAVIFAGAQKNVGVTGLTLVLIRSHILTLHPTVSTLRSLNLPIPPIMMHYPTLTAHSSLYNTLPIFDVYIASEVMQLLLSQGGIPAISASASRKAAMLYKVIDEFPEVYEPVVRDARVRSRMNVTFRIREKESEKAAEKRFFDEAEKRGLSGIKGHRSVGGGRVSCYNSIGEEEVQVLVNYMRDFAQRMGHGYLALN